MAAEHVCPGCSRSLPRAAANFYTQKGGDGLTLRCKECLRARSRERKARRPKSTAPKRCAGPCRRTLPRDAFPRDRLDRPTPRCFECVRAAELARDVERAEREHQAAERRERKALEPGKVCTGCDRRLPRTLEHFHRRSRSPDGLNPECKPCTRAAKRRRDAAEREAETAARVMAAVRAAAPRWEPPPESAAERAARLRRAAEEIAAYNAALLADPTPLCIAVPTARSREVADELVAGFDPLVGAGAVVALMDALADAPEQAEWYVPTR